MPLLGGLVYVPAYIIQSAEFNAVTFESIPENKAATVAIAADNPINSIPFII
jgi:hypothetical protein